MSATILQFPHSLPDAAPVLAPLKRSYRQALASWRAGVAPWELVRDALQRFINAEAEIQADEAMGGNVVPFRRRGC